MARVMTVVVLGLVIVLGAAGDAWTQSATGIVEYRGQAWVNWEAAVVKARGYGIPARGAESAGQGLVLARRAAILDGYRSLLELSLGITLRSRTVVEQAGVKWDTIEAQVEGVVRGAEILEERQHEDGRYEVILQTPLYGQRGLGQLILPPMFPRKAELTPSVPLPEPDAGYTGLLIIVKGSRLDRSMSPAVLTPKGEVVYGRGWWRPGEISQEFANEHGVVGYPSSRAAARRTGPRPLVVTAIGVSGPPLSEFKTDVIISDEDAARIRAANARGRFMERFLVDIVVER